MAAAHYDWTIQKRGLSESPRFILFLSFPRSFFAVDCFPSLASAMKEKVNLDPHASSRPRLRSQLAGLPENMINLSGNRVEDTAVLCKIRNKVLMPSYFINPIVVIAAWQTGLDRECVDMQDVRGRT